MAPFEKAYNQVNVDCDPPGDRVRCSQLHFPKRYRMGVRYIKDYYYYQSSFTLLISASMESIHDLIGLHGSRNDKSWSVFRPIDLNQPGNTLGCSWNRFWEKSFRLNHGYNNAASSQGGRAATKDLCWSAVYGSECSRFEAFMHQDDFCMKQTT